ncbi:MAG: tetratricopeptide repeat protein [Fimbriimonas sp.]
MAQAVDVEAIYEQAFQFRSEGRYGLARLEIQKVLAADPRHLKARHLLALILGFEGDFDGSIAALAALATEAPTNVAIRYDLAMSQVMLGMVDEAGANFREVLRLQPDHQDAKKQLAYF